MYDDQDLEAEARLFIEYARRAHRESNKRLGGPKRLTEAQYRLINAAVDQLSMTGTFNDFSGHEAVRKLLVNFDVLCKRNGIELPETIRPHISRLLTNDLFTNARAFLEKPTPKALEQYVSLTLYQGITCVGLSGEAEFAAFADSPWIFKHATKNNPTDPRSFLRRILTDIGETQAEAEFAELKDSPNIFKYAAVHNPKDPRGFLCRILADIRETQTEAEFAELKDCPSIFKYAAVHNPTDPRAALRDILANMRAMEAEEEFATLRDNPAVFKYAAIGHPTDPRAFLRNQLHERGISAVPEPMTFDQT
jgi:hypothetical protein